MKNIGSEDDALYEWGTHDKRSCMKIDEDGISYRQMVEFNAGRFEQLLHVWLKRDEYTSAKLIELDVAIFQRRLANLAEYAARGLNQTR